MYNTTTSALAFFLLAFSPLHAQDLDMSNAQGIPRVEGVLGVAATSVHYVVAGRTRSSTHMAFDTDEGVWIGITGSVSNVGDRSFVLTNVDGSVGIAMDSEKLHEYFLSEGRTVTVYGRVDKNFISLKVLKARAVFVQGEDPAEHIVAGEVKAVRMLTAAHEPGTVVVGRVTEITGRKVTLERANGLLIVDISSLSYDPMKAPPHMRVELGDLITAQGLIHSELWSGRVLKASALEVLKMGKFE